MIPRNAKNEHIKRLYTTYLKHADGKAEPTISARISSSVSSPFAACDVNWI